MSRSKRKAIYKDCYGSRGIKNSSEYWRPVRRVQKYVLRSCQDYEKLEIPNPKAIVNDYNYCDYRWKPEFKYPRNHFNCSREDYIEWKNKLSRK